MWTTSTTVKGENSLLVIAFARLSVYVYVFYIFASHCRLPIVKEAFFFLLHFSYRFSHFLSRSLLSFSWNVRKEDINREENSLPCRRLRRFPSKILFFRAGMENVKMRKVPRPNMYTSRPDSGIRWATLGSSFARSLSASTACLLLTGMNNWFSRQPFGVLQSLVPFSLALTFFFFLSLSGRDTRREEKPDGKLNFSLSMEFDQLQLGWRA